MDAFPAKGIAAMLILATERLHLRTVNADDAQFYLELVNDPSWIANIGDRGIRTVEAARAAILEGPVAAQLRLGYSLYMVERGSDGARMGLCGLLKRDFLPDTDIGYALAPRYWGHGYAYEAAAAVLGHARDSLKLPALMAITSPANTASNGLLEKLGLRFIERRSLPGYNEESNVYRIAF
jgi:RimJ/RimL family protein N-acetyltransferase